MNYRWRQIKNLDESYVLEQVVPSHKASNPDEVDGWLPLAWVWIWTSPDKSNTPWRAQLNGVNTEYTSLVMAMRGAEKHLGVRGTPLILSLKGLK